MPTSGPNSPATATTADPIGSDAPFADAGNVTASDNAYATVDLPGSDTVSDLVVATGFGFAIPGSATIVGVLVEVEGKATGAQDSFGVFLWSSGAILGSGNNSSDLTGSDAYYSVGSLSANTWGATLTPAIVNDAGFGAAVRAFAIDGAANVSIDHVRITIVYAEAAGGIQRMLRGVG